MREFSGKQIHYVKALSHGLVGGDLIATTKGWNYEFTIID